MHGRGGVAVIAYSFKKFLESSRKVLRNLLVFERYNTGTTKLEVRIIFNFSLQTSSQVAGKKERNHGEGQLCVLPLVMPRVL